MSAPVLNADFCKPSWIFCRPCSEDTNGNTIKQPVTKTWSPCLQLATSQPTDSPDPMQGPRAMTSTVRSLSAPQSTSSLKRVQSPNFSGRPAVQLDKWPPLCPAQCVGGFSSRSSVALQGIDVPQWLQVKVHITTSTRRSGSLATLPRRVVRTPSNFDQGAFGTAHAEETKATLMSWAPSARHTACESRRHTANEANAESKAPRSAKNFARMAVWRPSSSEPGSTEAASKSLHLTHNVPRLSFSMALA
mmetsp:Transcript_6690/g.25074  ORF Transcript_6690/g.25074 Transcript_6690/m.25074 type:complete len:248 (+) Transcript_6690:1329-2072(+)